MTGLSELLENGMLSKIFRTLVAHDEFAQSRLRKAPYLLVAIPLALLGTLFTWIGFQLFTQDAHVTPVAPEAGFEFVAILLLGTSYCPVFFVTSLICFRVWGVPWALAAGMSTATFARTLAAVWLARKVRGFCHYLGHFEEL
ncbi:MAG: hypothetical protein JO336_24535, partial [Acidobacteriia bacterium]|nr:hypothetical protein [Terriglobia bacterium]